MKKISIAVLSIFFLFGSLPGEALAELITEVQFNSTSEAKAALAGFLKGVREEDKRIAAALPKVPKKKTIKDAGKPGTRVIINDLGLSFETPWKEPVRRKDTDLMGDFEVLTFPNGNMMTVMPAENTALDVLVEFFGEDIEDSVRKVVGNDAYSSYKLTKYGLLTTPKRMAKIKTAEEGEVVFVSLVVKAISQSMVGTPLNYFETPSFDGFLYKSNSSHYYLELHLKDGDQVDVAIEGKVSEKEIYSILSSMEIE